MEKREKKQGQCNHPHLSLDANIFCVKASIALCVHTKKSAALHLNKLQDISSFFFRK